MLWQPLRNVIAGHSWCKGEGRFLASETGPQSFNRPLFAAAPAANIFRRKTTSVYLNRLDAVSERSSAAVSAWEALFRAQVAVVRELGRDFPTGDISFNEYDVLFNLSRQDGHRLRIRDLSKHLLLTQRSVSRMVDRLVSKGFVRKERAAGDGRGTFVCLTEDGYSLYRRVAVTHAKSIEHHVGRALGPDELRTLRTLTEQISKSVNGSAG